MQLNITTGGHKVISSGLVTAFNDEPISITIPNAKAESFELVFQFFTDNSLEGQNIEADTSGPKKVILKLTNFNSPLGTGTIHPIAFATDSDKKQLFINFYVYVVGKSSPTIHYTIYKEM